MENKKETLLTHVFDPEHFEHSSSEHIHSHLADSEHSHMHEHTHTHDDGTVHCHEHDHEHEHGHGHEHDHEHGHGHGHHHDPAEKKKQINRLSRIIGHLESVKRMIERDEDCSEVLVQISACKSSLNSLGKIIINEHMTHCITHAIETGDKEAVEEFQNAISKYI
ncbi:MAG: metal-sensing transcriptional repressor [Oscillospiraceae bacterium]|nr:metal-sensing transcriptional repressor [Oscillospiraceae bacterium]